WLSVVFLDTGSLAFRVVILRPVGRCELLAGHIPLPVADHGLVHSGYTKRPQTFNACQHST
ncbi:MAG: hypothetical protein K0R13_1412, partial [Propionibacteriaceae bacterium]|nr:hypothetical protein [Propionibacteriaceae bacterium]